MNFDQNPIFFIGYLFALINSVYVIGGVVNALWCQAECEYRFKRFRLQTTILGILETSFYYWLFILTLQFSVFSATTLVPIGAWLTLKTLPKIWDAKSKQNKKYIVNNLHDKYETWPGEKYNIFLIGNLLSIVSSLLISFLTYRYYQATDQSQALNYVLFLIIYFTTLGAAISFVKNYSNERDDELKITEIEHEKPE
jgi:hypothetical protein